MKKVLALGALLCAALVFGFGSSALAGGPPPPCTSPCNFTPGVLSPDYTNAQPPVEVGGTITTTDGTWDSFTSISAYKFQNGSTVLQSGASNTYTTSSANEDTTITAYVEGCDVTCVWQQSTGSARVVGTSKFGDDFNGALNSEPSSTDWTFFGSGGCQTSANLTYCGTNTMGEDGAGNLKMQAVLSSGTWYGAWLTSKTTYSGERYLEVRAKLACSADTGFSTDTAFEVGSGSPHLELNPAELDTGEGASPNNFDYKHNMGTNYWMDATHKAYHTRFQTESTQQCGAFHKYGMAVYSDHIDFFYDGAKELTVNKNDCGFFDWDWATDTTQDAATNSPPGTCIPLASGDSSRGTDGDSDGDSTHGSNISSDFTSFTQSLELNWFSDSTITGSGPEAVYIDYIHVNELS